LLWWIIWGSKTNEVRTSLRPDFWSGGKRWLLWAAASTSIAAGQRQLNALFPLNRRILKAYLSSRRAVRSYGITPEKGAMLHYLQSWIVI
jgi:hypothetical protein